MRHTALSGTGQAPKKDFSLMLLAFLAPALCAILGFIVASAIGYPPF